VSTFVAPGAIDLAVVVTGAVASVWDIRTRRIPNAVTFGSAAVAVAFHAFDAGSLRALPGAVGWSVGGWIVGLLLFLPLFLLGGMGAGDVKLLAALGAWLGPGAVFWVAIYGSLAGGVMALPLIVARRAVGRTWSNVWGLLGYWRLAGIRPHPGLTLETPGAIRLPYALPIALGALVTMWWRA
jgi:prepilin peptidase CpaA